MLAECATSCTLSHDHPSVRIVDSVSELESIFELSVNVVVLRRALPAKLVAEAAQLVTDPNFRKLLTATPGSHAQKALSAALTTAPGLAGDLASWVDVLAELTGSDRIGVRFARVNTAMCPRLHVDRVTLRAVGTYVGAATEYVSNEDVDRRWLGHAARGAPDHRSGLLRPGGVIQAAQPGDIVLLKGEAWPNNVGAGAVHRSPAVSDAKPRLVMTLDPL